MISLTSTALLGIQSAQVIRDRAIRLGRDVLGECFYRTVLWRKAGIPTIATGFMGTNSQFACTLKEVHPFLHSRVTQTVSPLPDSSRPALPTEPTPERRDRSHHTIALDVSGMKCAGCVRAVEQALQRQTGVITATVNLATEVATVQFDPDLVTPVELAHTLTDAGFPSQPRTSGTTRATSGDWDAQRQQEQQQQLWRLAIATLLLLLSALGHLELFTGLTLPLISSIWFHCGLATLALLFPGRRMIVEGWQGLRRNAPNMNTLVSLGTLTAYTTSVIALLVPQLGWECFFDEPVMLVGFILLGRTLEQQARHRAAAAFQALLAYQPQTARLVPSMSDRTPPDTALEIPAEAVRVGEWLQVLPGDRVPVDGTILTGQTTLDESMLTGEVMPVVKQVGDTVAAGTLNQSGVITIQATRTGQDTTIAQIIALVEAAQTRKAPVQKLADTVAGYFTYGVMAPHLSLLVSHRHAPVAASPGERHGDGTPPHDPYAPNPPDPSPHFAIPPVA